MYIPLDGFFNLLFQNIIFTKFSDTVACVGNPKLKVEDGAVQVKLFKSISHLYRTLFQMKQPFTMTVSPRCVSYYVVGLDTEGQEIYQGRGRCHECRVNPQVDISPYLISLLQYKTL